MNVSIHTLLVCMVCWSGGGESDRGGAQSVPPLNTAASATGSAPISLETLFRNASLQQQTSSRTEPQRPQPFHRSVLRNFDEVFMSDIWYFYCLLSLMTSLTSEVTMLVCLKFCRFQKGILNNCLSVKLMKFIYFQLLYHPWTKFRGVYRNHSVCLSVCLSVQIRVRPITFLWFDIGLPYLAYGCMTIRGCVTYIHDPDTTLNFDVKVKFIGFLTCCPVWPIIYFWIDISLPHLAHGCITIRQCVAYIHDPN